MAMPIAGQILRVLLVSTREGMRDEVGEALAGWAGDQRLFWVSQPDLACARAQDLVPHVILIDDALARANAIALIKELASRLPSAAILALVTEEAIGQARQAVLAGARGFVIKPLQASDLLNTLRQVLAPRHAPSLEGEAVERVAGCVVVFCASKGGTGRTTLALNTAVSLRMETEQSVALVDADYSAPALDVALNLHSERNVCDLLSRLALLDEDLVTSVLATHVTGVQVLLAPPPADLANSIPLPRVQHILALLKRMFTWVIVDLGLPLDESAFAFLDGADRIIVSVLPEMVGLRNTRLMLDQLRGRRYAEEKVWLVLNRATMQGGVSQGDIEERLRVR
ncbi:MAG: MinD/ParA family protein [Chloroflexi bacterium]|nr:MinD/ParA family protein [Chloroflexota bacterium]